ncbi:methyl-accepting chemotaxis protein [Pseudoalteromonas denitrificans]|uniref:Methyl-accepting chemotaxis sensory transducer n=1 Tax=Pseudoalteromonas denitrificans DSM 6059 TaxID=1123010 RepID=A0A1I1SBV8_9GAMM|nr:methyl-accepting chemotaxis protein [Pseudoalteromonas denitrificans]SFD41333.1 methyl-accepting chemotaxis sensory transducer [Pseudoalteromonas denitrificans DSM 6059]
MFNLSLSIKQKIILGFTTIGVLLIAGSSFFYYSLNEISTANNNVETLALPVEKQSNALQIKLLNMMKLGSLGFTQSNIVDLSNSKKKLSVLNEEYLAAVKVLSHKLSDQTKMLKVLDQTQSHYQAYITQSMLIFDAKISTAKAQKDYITHFKTFQTHRDNASDIMLDIETIEAPGQSKLLEVVIGSGTRIDDLLFTLQSTMSKLMRIDDVDTVKQHQEDIGFLLNNIKDNFSYLTQQAKPLNNDTFFSEFTIHFEAITKLLSQPGSLYKIQIESIVQKSAAKQAYKLTEQYFESTYQQLTLLVTLADQRFAILQTTAKDKISTGKTLAMGLALIFIVLASFIASITTRAMLGPLNAVNKALARIAQGDLTRRLEKRSDDEFGTLIQNINKLSDDLTALLNDISENTHLLEDSVKLSNQQSHGISQSTKAQINRVDNAKQLAEQMHSSSTLVTDEASLTADHVSEATKHSQEIRDIANSNNKRIMSLSEGLSDSVSVMSKLSEHSNSIGGILDTIGGIADQTNLLALNAAIEAARAGEHGRGFAVVADEVRSLASRTQDSTTEIHTMINALQNETTTAESAISQGQNQAAQCVSQSQELSNAVEQIEHALQTINQMSQSISNAAQEQLNYSQNIASTMGEASDAANNNANEAVNMTHRSKALNELAISLTNSVTRFKL